MKIFSKTHFVSFDAILILLQFARVEAAHQSYLIFDGCTLQKIHYVVVEQGNEISLDMGHKVVKSEIIEILIPKTST